MDLTKALVLSGLVFVLVEYAKQTLPDPWLAAKGVLAGAALVIGIAATFIAAETVWAHQDVVSGKPLDELNFWSKVVTGVFAGAGATFIHKTLQAVRNVGENHSQPE